MRFIKRNKEEVKKHLQSMQSSFACDNDDFIQGTVKNIKLLDSINHATFDIGKPFARKYSVNNLRIERTIETSKMSNWINRSLDQSAHSRLYNEAKYLDAKLVHQRRMQRHPDVDG